MWADRVQPLPAHERAAGGRPAGQQPDHGASAQRVATEVVAGKPEVFDQCESVVGQHVGRVGGGVVRPGAVAVAAQVRHDHAVPLRGELPGEPGLDQDHRVSLISVDQYQGPALPELTVGELHAVAAAEMADGNLSHGRSLSKLRAVAWHRPRIAARSLCAARPAW